MLIQDLVFRDGDNPFTEVAKVVFANGHWAFVARHKEGFISPFLKSKPGLYEVATSVLQEKQIGVSAIELSVTLSELRFTTQVPMSPNPWDAAV